MFSYKLIYGPDKTLNHVVLRSDGSCIPFDPANTDYQKFKKDVSDGVELQDPDGNVMTQEQMNKFLSTLP